MLFVHRAHCVHTPFMDREESCRRKNSSFVLHSNDSHVCGNHTLWVGKLGTWNVHSGWFTTILGNVWVTTGTICRFSVIAYMKMECKMSVASKQSEDAQLSDALSLWTLPHSVQLHCEFGFRIQMYIILLFRMRQIITSVTDDIYLTSSIDRG